MGRTGCFSADQQICAYNHCLAKFHDEHGNPTTITTRRPIETTEHVTPVTRYEETASGSFGGSFAIYIGSGCGGFGVLCFIIVLILCRSRNAEKHKRRIIEHDYRVVATTLTNVSDSDGTTYEELCIDNPHYNRHHDIQLPSKKERRRLPGVSNAMTDTFKRWISVDANQPTANTSKGLMQATNKPLPPIPESSKSLYKEVASNKLSESIDEYTEIGSEVQRRSNIYNPLDIGKLDGGARDSHGTYEMLRGSKMLENCGQIGLPPGEYFTLEKVNDELVPVASPNGEYMVLAKEEDLNETESDTLVKPDNGASGYNPPEIKAYAETARCVIEDEGDSGICESGPKNDYYILEKNAVDKDQTVEVSDYIEPVKGDKHSYMQVLPSIKPEYAKPNK